MDIILPDGSFNLAYAKTIKYADKGLFISAEYGCKDGIEYFIGNRGANAAINYAMIYAGFGGHIISIDTLVKEYGAYEWNWCMYGAARGGHQDVIDYCIMHGANEWNWGMRDAARGGHLDIVKFFRDKGASDLIGAMESADYGSKERPLVMDVNTWDYGMFMVNTGKYGMSVQVQDKTKYQDLISYLDTEIQCSVFK